MARRSFAGVPDHVLLRDLASLVTRDRATTCDLLQHLAEVGDRQLHRPAGYPSLYRYCVTELRMSEDTAYKRIQAARAAREFPDILDRLEDGRLHLTAVVLLAPHLTRENAAELLEAGSHKTKAELEYLLAERFPKADVPTVLQAVPAPRAADCVRASGVTEEAELLSTGSATSQTHELVPEPVVPSPGQNCAQSAVPLPSASAQAQPQPRPRLAPLAPERYALQVTLTKTTHDKLRRAQALLAHAVPSSDIAELLDRALDALIERVEKRRNATTSKPRAKRGAKPGAKRGSKNPRHIPAEVRRAVHERDGERCTFVSATGHRCEEKRFLEYDHVHPVARGGQATVENTRLRCRAHNQYEAERTYGAGFMREKRQAGKARKETASMLHGVAAERARMRADASSAATSGAIATSGAS
jgi:5-methylcytosine-specific restriction endonuclease McrA